MFVQRGIAAFSRSDLLVEATHLDKLPRARPKNPWPDHSLRFELPRQHDGDHAVMTDRHNDIRASSVVLTDRHNDRRASSVEVLFRCFVFVSAWPSVPFLSPIHERFI